MRKWIGDRRNQYSILLIALTLILTVNVITPLVEQRRYYQGKILRLQSERDMLVNYEAHLDHHKDSLAEIEAKTEELRSIYNAWANSSSIQKKLITILDNSGIRVTKQSIDHHEFDLSFDYFLVSQTLEGTYLPLMAYLSVLTQDNNPIVIDSCEFQNESPIKNNPVIQLEIKFKIFQKRP